MKKYYGLLLGAVLQMVILQLIPISLIGQSERGIEIVVRASSKPKNTYAIIMGISDYPNLKPLQYAHKDALLFKYFLQSDAGGNVPEKNIYTLLNEQATASNFWVGALGWLNGKNLQSGERLYMFMAGHGDAINEDEYFFLTHDCAPGNDKNNYLITGNLQLYNLKSRIKRWTAEGVEVILIVDACRTGDLPGGENGMKFFTGSIIEEKAGETMLLSAGPNQYSFEDKSFGGGHGLFTYYLIEGLSGFADENEDGDIVLYELEDYVKRKVRTQANTKYKQKQIPTFCCSEQASNVMSQSDERLRQDVMALSTLGSIFDGPLMAINTKRTSDLYSDTTGFYLYLTLQEKIRDEHFKGENNARDILNKMIDVCPECEITKEAKRDLAVAYLTFGQARINLYLAGKDDRGSIRAFSKSFINQNHNNENSKYLKEINISSVERLQAASFSDAEKWMKEAMALLNHDQELTAVFESKISFLELYNQFDGKKIKNQEKEYWITSIKEIVAKDSAAYILHLAGRIHSELGLDELAIDYYQRASAQAPGWSYPINNIGCIYFDSKKDYLEAERWFHKAIGIDSFNVLAVDNLGLSYEAQGEYVEAEKWYRKAIEVDSNFVKAYNNLGDLHLEQKRYAEAERWYRKAIEVDSNYVYAYGNLGDLHLKQKRYAEAERWYHKGIEVDSNYVYAYGNLGDLHLEQKRYVEAEKWYMKTIEVDSSYVYAYNGLGLSHEEQEDFGEAGKWYHKAIEVDSNFVYAYGNLGDVYTKQEGYVEARKWYHKAIGVDSQYVNAYSGLGFLFKDQGEYEEAEKWFRKAIEIDIDFVVAYDQIAYMYYRQGNFVESMQWFQRSISIDSVNFNSWLNLGAVSMQLGDYQSAVMYLMKSLKIKDDYALTYRNLGDAYKELMEFNEAEKWYFKALEVDSFSCDCAQTKLMDLYEKAENADKIKSAFLMLERYYLRNIEADVDNRRYYHKLAYLYLEHESYEKALEWFKKALSLNETDPWSNYNLTCLYSIIGNLDSALKYFERALENGFNDYEHIVSDNDLNMIRSHPRYISLMATFFPDNTNRN